MTEQAHSLHYECPHFERCNAPLCPLARGGSHVRDEPVCFYLREAVKAGGEARVRAALPSHLAEPVLAAARDMFVPHSVLHRQLQRAAKQASKLAIGAALREANKKRSRSERPLQEKSP